MSKNEKNYLWRRQVIKKVWAKKMKDKNLLGIFDKHDIAVKTAA